MALLKIVTSITRLHQLPISAARDMVLDGLIEEHVDKFVVHQELATSGEDADSGGGEGVAERIADIIQNVVHGGEPANLPRSQPR